MNILGIEKSSFIDYPNKIATVVFTGGCNFRCPYCHNRALVYEEATAMDVGEILEFMKSRRRYIDAICISGGEPTLQADLPEFIEKVRSEGFSVKLDTNGTNPAMLEALVQKGLVDYVAMDIKAPFELYSRAVGTSVNVENIRQSVALLMKGQVDYEFRTTVAREILTKDEIIALANQIKGGKTFFLQNFHDGDEIIGGKNVFTPYPLHELKRIGDKIAPLFQNCKIR